MIPQRNPRPTVVEFDQAGGRVQKLFQDYGRALKFFRSKHRLGREPKMLPAATAPRCLACASLLAFFEGKPFCPDCWRFTTVTPLEDRS